MSQKMRQILFFMITLMCTQNCCAVTQGSALKESDHLALLAFKSKIVEDPEGALSSWNDSSYFCQWTGVTCGKRHRRVTALDLSSKGLVGSLSPIVGNLSFLRMINLQNNTFKGIIPPEIGHLFRLEQIYFDNNSFEGNIPTSISNCTSLQSLWLSGNKLVGTILQEATLLLKLVELVIDLNNFSGKIPPSIGNLTSLESISAMHNQFSGSIPSTLGQLKKLGWISFDDNQLHGIIPPSFYNLSLLYIIGISRNQFVGNLPPNIGLMLPKLEQYIIWENYFTGLLPLSISNCSELELFDVGDNRFHGKIAIDFGMMPNLWIVDLRNNILGSGEPDEMNFIASLVNCSNLNEFRIEKNQVRRQLPSCVGNLSAQLSILSLAHNFIFGSIPPSMMNLVGVERLQLNNNQFTGTIPGTLGNLRKLVVLLLEENSLTGNIPKSVGNLSFLNQLTLQNNKIYGTIPTTFENCRNLILLNISLNNLTGSIPRELLKLSSLAISLNLAHNHLSGSLPREIGNLRNLNELDLSENQLTGNIPSDIGDCASLEYLYLEGNFFQGLIPLSFGSLAGIQNLDLSSNNFSGQIPRFLEKFSLKILNLSFNNFEGKIPINGVFKNASAISVSGNSRLCGGIPALQLPKCKIKKVKRSKRISLALIIVISTIGSLVGTVLVSYCLYLWSKRRTKTEPSAMAAKQLFMQYSYETLHKATNGFSSENLIGTGSFSCVYKGVLENETTVAIKVLNLELRGASSSFMAECEVWRNIRHHNLVKIISACSSIDLQGNDFKALIYEFMPKGSLESWLHPTPGPQNAENDLCSLSLLQRMNTATDVAHAIDYLHHQGEIPIVHCDLKPSNILFSEDMVAHVGDFGLARLLLPEGTVISQNSSVGLRGTIGYAPPEYGVGNEISVKGDVYSFGILLLEMMTGKRPTESMFENGLNLHSFARKALSDSIIDIVDLKLVKEVENETYPAYAKQMVECMVSAIKLGVSCSMESAEDRMDISQVVHALLQITNILSHHEIVVAR